jgi:predicted NBD/HSP70 family sugar kinase
MSHRAKATHQQTRLFNKQLVLRTIFDHRQISRAEIARYTDLTPVSVSEIVAELMAEDLVVESEDESPSTGRRGRRPVLLGVAADAQHILAIRLAVHEFRGAILNLNGEFVYSKTVQIENERGYEAVDLIHQLIDDLSNHSSRPFLGIGIAGPGIIDTHNGVIRRSVFFDWNALPLGDILHKRWNLPVHLANASQLAALAEYIFGNRSDLANLAVVRVGQDVGAGLILNGQLYFGDGFGAGEIGHIVLKPNGELCRCGNRGCLETLVSSRAIVKRALMLAQENPTSLLAQKLFQNSDPSLDAVLAAHQQGDPLAHQIAEESAEYLAQALTSIVAVLNVQRILFVGSVTQFGEPWLQQIRAKLPTLAIPNLVKQTTLAVAEHGSDAVILGAAALLLSRELGLTLNRQHAIAL